MFTVLQSYHFYRTYINNPMTRTNWQLEQAMKKIHIVSTKKFILYIQTETKKEEAMYFKSVHSHQVLHHYTEV